MLAAGHMLLLLASCSCSKDTRTNIGCSSADVLTDLFTYLNLSLPSLVMYSTLHPVRHI